MTQDLNFLKNASKSPLKLTQTVQKGGCAAKVAAHELRNILSQVQFPKTPVQLKVGPQTFDDAAIYALTPDQYQNSSSLVQTLDFFTPIVDSPRWFGKIAAANSLSDVYAMGGDPITAMAILAFPLATMDSSVAVEVLQGACEILEQAQTPLVGGHSIDDDTLKFGLSVTGLVNPEHTWSNAGAKVGDVLILTKALGTGTLTAGLKRQALTEDQMTEALQSMAQLNRVKPALGLLSNAVHAATDITGFGLAGHSSHIALASEVSLEIDMQKLPTLEGALECLQKEFLTKAHRTNREYVQNICKFQNEDRVFQQLVMDPQTSGGLLLSVEEAQADAILQSLRNDFPRASIIGKVVTPQEKKLIWK